MDLDYCYDPPAVSGGGGVGGWSRSPKRVEPGGWGEHRPPVHDRDVPGGVVDDVVVVIAEEHQVVQGGRSAVGPVLDVMGVGPPRRSPAAGEGASSVAGDQGPAQPGWDGPGGSANVEWFGVGPQDG